MRELMTLVTLLLATTIASPLAEAQTLVRDKPPIIDMHLHAFQLPDGVAPPVNPVTGRPSTSLTTVELRDASLAALARYNIVKAVTSGPAENGCAMARCGTGAHPRRCRSNTAAADLIFERTKTVGDYGAADRLHQYTVLRRYLVHGSHEDSSSPFCNIRLDSGGNEPQDLLMQDLPVPGVIFVPDYKVHCQSFETPVCVGLHELAHQVYVGRISDLQQHDREVAGK